MNIHKLFKIRLLLTLFFVFLSVLFSFNLIEYGRSTNRLIFILVSLLLFNSTHIAAVFGYLFDRGMFGQHVREKVSLKRKKNCFDLILCISVAVTFGTYSVVAPKAYVFSLLKGFFLLYALWHILQQSKGLYFFALTNSQNRFEYFEKKLVTIFCIFTVILVAVSFLFRFLEKFEVETVMKEVIIPVLLGTIIIIWVSMIALFGPHEKDQKIYGVLGFSLFPFLYINPLASMGALAIHGVEYMGLFAAYKEKNISKISSVIIGLIIFYYILFIGLYDMEEAAGVLYGLNVFLAMFHYKIDGKIFHLKENTTKILMKNSFLIQEGSTRNEPSRSPQLKGYH